MVTAGLRLRRRACGGRSARFIPRVVRYDLTMHVFEDATMQTADFAGDEAIVAQDRIEPPTRAFSVKFDQDDFVINRQMSFENFNLRTFHVEFQICASGSSVGSSVATSIASVVCSPISKKLAPALPPGAKRPDIDFVLPDGSGSEPRVVNAQCARDVAPRRGPSRIIWSMRTRSGLSTA